MCTGVKLTTTPINLESRAPLSMKSVGKRPNISISTPWPTTPRAPMPSGLAGILSNLAVSKPLSWRNGRIRPGSTVNGLRWRPHPGGTTGRGLSSRFPVTSGRVMAPGETTTSTIVRKVCPYSVCRPSGSCMPVCVVTGPSPSLTTLDTASAAGLPTGACAMTRSALVWRSFLSTVALNPMRSGLVCGTILTWGRVPPEEPTRMLWTADFTWGP